MMFSKSGIPSRQVGLPTARRGLELGLLDEVAVLVRDQMALDLADRIHGHVDDDQQASAAEPQVGEPSRSGQNLGNRADHDQIGSTNHRDSVEQIVEIFFGRLSRTNPRNEAAMSLQILGG